MVQRVESLEEGRQVQSTGMNRRNLTILAAVLVAVVLVFVAAGWRLRTWEA